MISPTNDRIVIQPLDAPSQTDSGIYLSESARDNFIRGKVIAVGPGKMLDSGKRAAMMVSVDDIVLAHPRSGQKIKHDGIEVIILSEGEILGIIEED